MLSGGQSALGLQCYQKRCQLMVVVKFQRKLRPRCGLLDCEGIHACWMGTWRAPSMLRQSSLKMLFFWRGQIKLRCQHILGTERIRHLAGKCVFGHDGKGVSLYWKALDYAGCSLLAGISQQSSLAYQEVQRSLVIGLHKVIKQWRQKWKLGKNYLYKRYFDTMYVIL